MPWRCVACQSPVAPSEPGGSRLHRGARLEVRYPRRLAEAFRGHSRESLHSTRKNDRFFKPIEYAMARVPHYWRVEAEPELFVVTFVLADGAYVETGRWAGVHDLAAPYALVLDVPAL